MNTYDTTRDREMILHPLRWPYFVLPLVNVNDPGTVACFNPSVVMDEISGDEPITLMLCNIFAITADALRKTYVNVDALLADGWRVD